MSLVMVEWDPNLVVPPKVLTAIRAPFEHLNWEQLARSIQGQPWQNPCGMLKVWAKNTHSMFHLFRTTKIFSLVSPRSNMLICTNQDVWCEVMAPYSRWHLAHSTQGQNSQKKKTLFFLIQIKHCCLIFFLFPHTYKCKYDDCYQLECSQCRDCIIVQVGLHVECSNWEQSACSTRGQTGPSLKEALLQV